MRAPGRTKSASEADLIAQHPAMRRILDSQRAWIDGGRLLAYRTALELDVAKHHPDAARRDAAQRWCSLATPVLKAAFTHQAFYGGSECLQVFGGHGYIREWGVEQNVRDARVAMIYEGTNEIQAIDLLVRKVVADKGVQFMQWMDDLGQGLGAPSAANARVQQGIHKLEECTQALCARAAADATQAYGVADDYLRAVAVLLLDWAWAQIENAGEGTDGAALADAARWSAPAQAMQRWIAPELDMRLHIIASYPH